MWSGSCSITGDNLSNHVLAAPFKQSWKAVGHKSLGQDEIVAASLKSFTNLLGFSCGSPENWDSLKGRLSKDILDWGGEFV